MALPPEEPPAEEQVGGRHRHTAGCLQRTTCRNQRRPVLGESQAAAAGSEWGHEEATSAGPLGMTHRRRLGRVEEAAPGAVPQGHTAAGGHVTQICIKSGGFVLLLFFKPCPLAWGQPEKAHVALLLTLVPPESGASCPSSLPLSQLLGYFTAYRSGLHSRPRNVPGVSGGGLGRGHRWSALCGTATCSRRLLSPPPTSVPRARRAPGSPCSGPLSVFPGHARSPPAMSATSAWGSGHRCRDMLA